MKDIRGGKHRDQFRIYAFQSPRKKEYKKMKLNIYVIYDKDNQQAGELFTAINDEQAKKRLKSSIEYYKKGGMKEEDLKKSLSILNIGAYNTKIIVEQEIKDNQIINKFDSVICIDEVYDIQDIPVGFIPRTSKLDEEEKQLYQKVKEQLTRRGI